MTKGEANRWLHHLKSQETQNADWNPSPTDNRTILELAHVWQDLHGKNLLDVSRKKRLFDLCRALGNPRINELGQISTSDNSEYVSGVKSYYNRTFSAILALCQIFLVFELTLLFLPKKSELWWRSYLNVFLKGLLFLIPVLIFPTMYMDYPAPVYLHLLGFL